MIVWVLGVWSSSFLVVFGHFYASRSLIFCLWMARETTFLRLAEGFVKEERFRNSLIRKERSTSFLNRFKVRSMDS